MVVSHWNSLPKEVVDVPFLEMFSARMDGALGSLINLPANSVHRTRVGNK